MIIDDLILKAVKADTITERTEALAELKAQVIIPLKEKIKDQAEIINLQDKKIDDNIKELKIKNKTLEQQKETMRHQEQLAYKNKKEIEQLNLNLETKTAILDDLARDNAKKRTKIDEINYELETTKVELSAEKAIKTMADTCIDFYDAFSILDVNTKFNIPSGKLMKWCRKNKYIAPLKAEVLDAGKTYFKVINKSGFPSIGVTPNGVNFVRTNLDEILA